MVDTVALGEVCTRITKGTTPTISDGGFATAGVNYIKSECLSYDGLIAEDKFSFISAPTHERLTRSNIQERDILYSIAGANLGKCGVAKAHMLPANTNQAVAIIRVDSTRGSPEYVSYVLRASAFVQSVLGGVAQSAQPNVNLADIGRFRVPNWPLSTQIGIAGTLLALDEKIELNRRMNEALEAMTQAIFRDWFIDFGPVRRKLAGATDPVEIMGGLTPDPARAAGLAALFPVAIGGDGLPQGFKTTDLGRATSVLETGKRPKGGVKGILEGVPSIGAESIVGLAKFNYEKTKFVPREFFATMKRGVLGERDILMYKDGGRPGEFEPHIAMFGSGFPFEECCINEHVYRIVGRPPYGQEYLYLHLTSEATLDEMRNKGTGVAIPGLNSTAAASLELLDPGTPLMDSFADTVRPLFDLALRNAVSCRTLAETRDYLLPRLMSGEVRVGELGKEVAA